jgi:hypothetical protein
LCSGDFSSPGLVWSFHSVRVFTVHRIYIQTWVRIGCWTRNKCFYIPFTWNIKWHLAYKNHFIIPLCYTTYIQHLLCFQFAHTHTHTHIYIYIYILKVGHNQQIRQYQTGTIFPQVKPLTPELNPSAQRCLLRFITGYFNFSRAYCATSV